MYCTCGSDISSAKATCPACGRYIPCGVGGWLLFLIIALVFIGPVAYVARFLGSFPDVMQRIFRANHPYLKYGLYFAEQLGSIAVRGYGVFAGIQLWRVRPGAVQHAKRFTVAILVFSILDFTTEIIWMILMTPERRWGFELRGLVFGKAARSLLATAIGTVIWYSYLLKSVRVERTYSPKVEPETRAAHQDTYPQWLGPPR